MTHDDFRILVFDVIEHHVNKLDDCNTSEDIEYHADRIRWAVQYLKRFTVATPVERRPPDRGCIYGGMAETSSGIDGKSNLEEFNVRSKIHFDHTFDDGES